MNYWTSYMSHIQKWSGWTPLPDFIMVARLEFRYWDRRWPVWIMSGSVAQLTWSSSQSMTIAQRTIETTKYRLARTLDAAHFYNSSRPFLIHRKDSLGQETGHTKHLMLLFLLDLEKWSCWKIWTYCFQTVYLNGKWMVYDPLQPELGPA